MLLQPQVEGVLVGIVDVMIDEGVPGAAVGIGAPEIPMPIRGNLGQSRLERQAQLGLEGMVDIVERLLGASPFS